MGGDADSDSNDTSLVSGDSNQDCNSIIEISVNNNQPAAITNQHTTINQR